MLLRNGLLIKLTLNMTNVDVTCPNFVIRIGKNNNCKLEDYDGLIDKDGKVSLFDVYPTFNILEKDEIFDDGEIWIVFPKNRKVSRFYRPSANSNTILLTEQCDQMCLMCSQPPKNKDYLHIELYKEALKKIACETTIGISGGEPTLFKNELFELVEDSILKNPLISFHILTNAQHFCEEDIPVLEKLRNHVLWAVPIYGSEPEIHNKIVGKELALSCVLKNLAILARAGSSVEIRTVILQQNFFNLIKLANFISVNLSWVHSWSLMQLEPIGYAKLDWHLKFFDTSRFFGAIGACIETAIIKKINIKLYNFPMCSVPKEFRKFTVKSISDWKNKFTKTCSKCVLKPNCAGFFEWQTEEMMYANIIPTFKEKVK